MKIILNNEMLTTTKHHVWITRLEPNLRQLGCNEKNKSSTTFGCEGSLQKAIKSKQKTSDKFEIANQVFR